MPGASIALDQDRPSGTSFGTPGIARNDLWVGRTIRPRSAIGGNGGQVWTLVGAPAGSTAFITDPDDVTCALTPDLSGTYIFQLVTNGGGTGNNQTLVARCRYDVNGALTNRGWALPGVGELQPFANYDGNERGWDEPWDFIIADLLANASFSGGGGVTAVQDNGRAARARSAGLMRAIGVTTTLSAPATEATGLGRVNSWVSGPSTDTALVVGLASGAYYFLDALTMQPDTNSGSVPGGGPVHIYCSGGKAVMVGATKAVIVEPNGSASAVTITSPSNFGGYAISVPGPGNQEILLITSPADATVYFYNLTTGGSVGYAYTAAPGSNPTGICVDNEGAIWIEFVADGTATNAFLAKFTCSTAGVLTPAGVSVAHFLTTTNLVFDGRYIWGVASNGTNAVLQQVRVADGSFALDVLSTNCTTRASLLWDGELIVVGTTNSLIKVHPETFEQKLTQTVASSDLGALTLSPDGKALFYSSMVTGTPALAKYANPRAEELDRLGLTSAGDNAVLYTSPHGEVLGLAPGTNGYVFTMVTGAPAWAPPPVSFTAGNDLSGTNTSQTVVGFYNTPLDTSMSGPADGDFIQKISGKWSAITAAVLTAALVVADFPPGTSGQILTTVLGATAWASPPSGFTAGGDLTGTSTSQTVVSISGASPVLIENASVFEWADSVANPTFTQATRTTDNPPQNLEIHAQYPWVSATGSNRLPGTVTMTLSDPHFLLAGGFLIQYGTTPLIRMGEYVGNGADSGVIWFKDGGAPSTSNWNIRGTASALYLNAPSGGNMIFEVGATGTVWLEINASGVILPQLAGSGSGLATIDNSGVIGFTSTVPSGGISPGTAGQIFVSNATPTAVWTSLISYETTHGRFTSGGGGSDYKAIFGPTVTEETSTASLWLLPNATAPILTNVSLRSDGASLYVNAQSGNIYFYQGLSQLVMQLIPGSYMALQDLPSILWSSSAVAPNITQSAATSDVAPQNLYLVPQAPYVSAVTNIDSGTVQITLPASIGAGSSSYGRGLLINYAGTEIISLGTYAGGGYGGIWFAAGGSHTSTNYAFLGSSSSSYFNASTSLIFTIGGSTYPGLLDINHFSLGSTYSSYAFQWEVGSLGNTGIQHFTTNATSPTLVVDQCIADVTPVNLKIKGQYAYSGATTNAHGTSGSVIVDLGPPTHGTIEAYFQVTRNAAAIAQLGVNKTSNTYGQLWLGTTTFTDSNPILVSDASTFAYMNVPNGISAWGVIAGNASFLLYITTAQNVMYWGGSGAGSPIAFTWSTATTPLIQGGTSATSLTVGTDNASGELIFQAGSAVTAMTINGTSPSTSITVVPNLFQWDAASTTPTLTQVVNGSGTGVLMLIQAQQGNVAGNDTGGALSLSSGLGGGSGTAGELQLQIGGVAVMTVDPVGSGTQYQTTSIGSWLYNHVTKSSNYTINSGGNNDYMITVTTTLSLTLPAPQAGMFFIVNIDYNPASSGALDIVRHASEKINGVAATWSSISTATWAFTVLFITSNGIDWFVRAAVN